MTNIIPQEICLEASASCQLSCPGCPTGRNMPGAVGSSYLRFADFKDLLSRNPRIGRVSFVNRGEMFLNPELPSIIEYAARMRVSLSCDNGVNLNYASEEALEALVKFRFNTLRCSIDGATAATYRRYRVHGDLNRVLNNIREINRYKRKYRSRYPELIWQFIVFGHNEHELPAARKLAADLGMRFEAKLPRDAAYSPVRDVQFVLNQTGLPAATREDFAKTTGFDYARGACYSLWFGPLLSREGKVLGCCWNDSGEFGLNAFRDGYAASANGAKISHARRMLLGKAAHRDDLPCSSCVLYKGMRESGNYLSEAEVMRARDHRIAGQLAGQADRLT